MHPFINELLAQRLGRGQINEISVRDKYEMERNNGKTNLPFDRYSEICALDPTTKPEKAGRYCNWLLHHVNDNTDLNALRVALEQYNDGLKRGILNREGVSNDIGSFKTCEDFISTIQGLMKGEDVQYSNSELANRERLAGQFEVYLSNNEWDVIAPKTWEAERYFGRDTKWCTVGSKGYFDAYMRQGQLFINYPKNGKLYIRSQFHFKSKSFADVNDAVYSNPKKCIYNVVGEHGYEALAGLWSKKRFFGVYPFIRFSDVPGLLMSKTPPEDIFDYVSKFQQGFAVVKLRDRYNFLTQHNTLLTSDMWYENAYPFQDGLARVRTDKGWNFIKQDGHYINESQWYKNCWSFEEGFAVVRTNKGWNFVKPDGRYINDDRWYQNAWSFQEGLAKVRVANRGYNFIKGDGYYLTPGQWYQAAGSFSRGFAIVQLDDKRFYLRHDGFLCEYRTKQPLPADQQPNFNAAGANQQVNETKYNNMIDKAEYIRNRVEAARKEVNRDPSEGQKHAGNYKMGHLTINGYDISLENPKGSYRRGTDPDGKKWSCKMYHDYGYFRSTNGKDGDAIDVFIGDDYDSRKIFVIDQIIKGKFDESKVMFCFKSEEEAMKGYLANYEKGWSAGKHITEVSDDVFREWLYDGYKQRKPFYQYVKIKQNKLNEMMDIARAVLQESKKPKAYVNMGVELRKGGRNAVKMSVEDFRKEAIAAYKQYIMHCGSSNGMGSPNIECFGYCCTCGVDLRSYGPLKDLYKDVWEGKYEFDNENHEVSGDVKMSSKGVPYIELYAGGDWESPVCYFVYFDGSKFRGYVPLKGNAICRDTNAAFGNDDEAETKFLRKEFNVKDGEESPVDYDYVNYNAKACLEDFMSRIDVKGSYKPRDLSKIDEEYDEFIKQEKAKKEELDESWAPGIPKVCPKCGSKVGLYIKGEPVYLCSNEDCREYFGTMPFPNHNRKAVAENIVRKILRENEEWRNRVLDRLQNAGSSRLFACFKAINPDATCNLDVYSFNNWLRDPRTRSLITDDEVAIIEKTLDKLGDKGNPGGMIRYDETRTAKSVNETISRCEQSVQGKRTITVSESQVRELSKRIDKRKEIINKLAQMTMLQQIELIKRLCGTITDPVGIVTSFYNKLQAGVNGDYARSFTSEEFERLETIL